MKDHQDAFGHALLDYLRGRGSLVDFAEREDGYIDVSGSRNAYLANYESWPSHHKRAMEYVKGRVLDIGCGAGRHALHLQHEGFFVQAVDVSPLAIRVCKLRGIKRARVMSINAVASKLGVFDTVLMLGANFGLFESCKKARWLLRRLHHSTAQNARIIAESRDPYRTTEPFHLEYHRFNRRRGRMAGQVRIRIRYRKYATGWFDYLFVSRDEMRKILEGTGWKVNRFLSSKGPMYIAVIQKQARASDA
ncbi:MAG TPA: class I SAM-dependent methyltransferase [bacterium]|nr:class I SAM-dependent methyltransferase [bacterium]